MDDRRTFLLEMYRQMFADINRHMTVVWQSVSVLIGAFALFALVEKAIVPADVATSLIVLLCAWLIAHMLDAAYWYNRNLVIIANIERQFLLTSDKHDIQFYFVKHRTDRNKMITHLRIQAALGMAIALLVIVFHFSTRVWPGMFLDYARFDPARSLPYLVFIASAIYCRKLQTKGRRSYQNFLQNSPGIPADSSGITFGSGHPTD
jgi:hypothetical protein